MSVIATDLGPAGVIGPAATAISFAGRAADFIRRRIAIARHRRLLHAMSDRTLHDIGIGRSQIDWIVAERLDQRGRPRGPYPF